MSKSIISVRTTALVLAFAVLLSAMCPTAFAVQTPVQAFGEPGQPCEHNYETVLTAPTCTRIGCTIYMCLFVVKYKSRKLQSKNTECCNYKMQKIAT